MVRLFKLSVVASLTLSLGLHWAFLQSVAWASMMVNYSQTASIKEAIIKTFDGKHPCQLCRIVRAGSQAEKKPEVQTVKIKFDFCVDLNEVEVCPPTAFTLLSALECDSLRQFALEPSVPPPRAA